MDTKQIITHLKNTELKSNKGLFNATCNDLFKILEKEMPFIFNENKKVNKLNFIKKSLRDGYKWDSYINYDNSNEFNKKYADIQYINYIINNLISNKKLPENVPNNPVNQDNNGLMDTIIEQQEEINNLDKKMNEKWEEAEFHKKLWITECKSVEWLNSKLADYQVAVSIGDPNIKLKTDKDKDDEFFKHEFTKDLLEKKTAEANKSHFNNANLRKDITKLKKELDEIKKEKIVNNTDDDEINKLKELLATAKEQIKDQNIQLKNKNPVPAPDIPSILKDDNMEVISENTIKYNGKLYWCKKYIDLKIRGAEKRVIMNKDKYEDAEYKLDKAKLSLENYMEGFTALKKENQQLKFKLDKGEMKSKKELINEVIHYKSNINELENEIEGLKSKLEDA